ncbi:MAG: dTDP-glucose 4,6-dehydratase [Candidatus Peribacteraceae bacterium]
MTNILVTGGAGFIGSHFVLRHVAQHPSDTVVVLDKLTYAADKHFLDAVIDRITFVEGDIADEKLVSALIQKYSIDTIVNFAAESHVDRSIDDPMPFLHTNVIGTQSILSVCRAHPSLRLLHISTDEVYGDLEDGERPKIPTDPLRPSSPYAASKAASDLLVLAAIRTYGVNALISRCTNNYGPHQASEKFLPTVIRSALSDKPIPIYAEGKNKRDWLFVTDHTDALERVLASDWSQFPERVAHVSADMEQENIAVAKQVLALLGKPESLLTFVKDRPGHDWRYALDSSVLRKMGWKPQVQFTDGVRQALDWYQAMQK